MVSVSEATAIIQDHLYTSKKEQIPLTIAAGRILAESIYTDRDFPPFNRVAMDGIAVVFDRLGSGQRTFVLEDIQPAGKPPKKLKDPTKCIEVMTGAVLPEGADCVIKYEDLEIHDGMAKVIINDFQRRQNIHNKGQDVTEGEELLKPGIMLGPSEIALLASVGKLMVWVWELPHVAVVSTGDELVDIAEIPELHQIRRSNSYALYAALRQMGCEASTYHIQDDAARMEEQLKVIIDKHDVIILSGGVSQGMFDFVPHVLERLGVQKLFHQVSQRPGKPFWFGATSYGKIIFALPGNPVSTYMCFYRYIRPWLLKSMGAVNKDVQAILSHDFTFPIKLTYFLQVSVRVDQGKLIAHPLRGGGSGDFANLKDVDGFLELPAEKAEFKAGEVYSYIPFRHIQ